MAQTRFQVCYFPRAAITLAAQERGWTEESGESLLDAVDHFSFYEVDSEHPSLETAVARAKKLVGDEQDFFGQATVEEQEYQLVVPDDNYWQWETVIDHSVDESGLIESVRRES